MTDHGRGASARTWQHHGASIEGADDIWLAATGPGVPPLGDRAGTGLISQNQVAATIAKLMGFGWRADAGKPIRFEPVGPVIVSGR